MCPITDFPFEIASLMPRLGQTAKHEIPKLVQYVKNLSKILGKHWFFGARLGLGIDNLVEHLNFVTYWTDDRLGVKYAANRKTLSHRSVCKQKWCNTVYLVW